MNFEFVRISRLISNFVCLCGEQKCITNYNQTLNIYYEAPVVQSVERLTANPTTPAGRWFNPDPPENCHLTLKKLPKIVI